MILQSNLTSSFSRVHNERNNNTKNYTFDQVFNDGSSQETIYKRTRVDFLVQQVLAGFHSTVFVYGQTGSGKTYTMDGYKYAKSPSNPSVLVPQIDTSASKRREHQFDDGLIPRAIRQLFEQVKLK